MLISKAIDRLLAEQGVDPGIEVEGDKLPRASVGGIHAAEFMAGEDLWTMT